MLSTTFPVDDYIPTFLYVITIRDSFFAIFPVSAQWNSVHSAIRIIIPQLRYLINCGDY